MNTTEKLNTIEAISLILIVILNKVIIILPQRIINNTGSGAWLNVLYVCGIAILLTLFAILLFKNFYGQNIFDVSYFLCGKTLKNIMQFLYFLLLIIVPIYIYKNVAESLKIIYFRSSPLIYVLLFLVVCSFIANCFNLKALAKANAILIWVSFIGIIVILLSAIKHFSFDRLFPILGYGYKNTFITGLESLFSFSGIGYIFLLNPLLDSPQKLKKISLISISISALCLIATVTAILLSFSFSIQGGESFSLYLLSRNVELGRFIQRVDAVFILFWIISIVLYTSLAIKFAIQYFGDTLPNVVVHIIILMVTIIPCSLAQFNAIVETTFKFLVFAVLFIISFIILILANLKLKLTSNRKDL